MANQNKAELTDKEKAMRLINAVFDGEETQIESFNIGILKRALFRVVDASNITDENKVLLKAHISCFKLDLDQEG